MRLFEHRDFEQAVLQVEQYFRAQGLIAAAEVCLVAPGDTPPETLRG